MGSGSGRTLILGYHRVLELERDPHRLSVHPDRFAEHLKHLAHHVDIVPLSAARERSRERRVVITFDDGYVDNAETARSILEGAGAPATIFVTAGMVGKTQEFWWDKLESLLLSHSPRVDHVELEIEGRRLWMDVRSPAARERALQVLFYRLVGLPVETIERVVQQLASTLRADAPDRQTHRVMSRDELLSLSDGGLIEVGAHSLSHSLLATLPVDRQREEIAGSRTRLRELTGRDVAAFAYPYGGKGAFDRTTAGLVEESGYAFACTGLPGPVPRGGDPVLLPRHFVLDWDEPEFGRRLSRWLDD